jgi:polysaccharide chain length determinant protein (PEP-CTERM system associated)
MKDLSHLEVRDYFEILWRRRWYSLIAFVLIVSGVSVYVWLMPDVFKSETRIRVDEPSVSEDYVRPAVRSTPDDRINSIREQLASRSFLERIIEQFPLYGYGTRPDFEMESAVKSARKQIGIEKTSDNTFTISFVSSTPLSAQQVTKQLSEELIRISTSSKKDKVLATNQFIVEQLAKSSDELAAQEEIIKKFKTSHLGELPEQGNANMSALTGLHSQLTATENAIQQAQERQKMLDFKIQERKRLNMLSESLAAAEGAVRTPENKANLPSSVQVELTVKKELLAQYLAKYTPNHPDVITLTKDINRLEQQIANQKPAASQELTPIGATTAAVDKKERAIEPSDPMDASFKFEADSIRTEIAKREKEREGILQQIKVYQSRLNLAPALDQALATLLRERDLLQGRNDALQKQKFDTQMATTAAEIDKKNAIYSIIDDANLPVKAQYPNRLQLVLMGIAGGLALGVGAAIGRELLDNTIGGEEEAKMILNLPILVTIPTIPKEKKKKIA